MTNTTVREFVIDAISQYHDKLNTDIISHIDKIPLSTATPAASFTIDPYKMYNFGTLSRSMTITFNTSKEESEYVSEYMFRFTAGSGCNITLPNTVKYNGGEQPTFVNGHVYEYSITDNLCVVGEFY